MELLVHFIHQKMVILIQQAQLMQSAVTISSQEREEMKETMEDLKAEIIELRGSTESFGSSVERVATSVEYSRA